MRMHIITIPLLQISQISEMAGAACHGEGKPAFVWLGFHGPDCNAIAEQGGGPDARPAWAGSGPRAGGCPTLP